MSLETLSFRIDINATPDKVWNALWQPSNYEKWTVAFSAGSTMQSDWKVNGRTLFLGAAGEAMVSTIVALNKPFEVVFEHIGFIENGREALFRDVAKEYDGAKESYSLTEKDGKTTLTASVQTSEAHKASMNNGFTKGLEIVKQIAETI